MDWPKTLTLAVSVLALAGIVVLFNNGIHASIDALRAEASADRRAHRAEAAADRRAHQDAMDEFRAQMLSLAERQAHIEGHVEAFTKREAAGQ